MASLRSIVVLLAILALPGAARGADCLSGTVTAELTAPGSGLYRYCVTFTYDATAFQQGPSHFDLVLFALASCTCVCSPGYFTFETPAGTSPGTDAITGLPCTVQYHGDFLCDGDPQLPQYSGPIVKWDVQAGSTCDPDAAATATLCFLSVLPPGAPSSATVAIKIGASSTCSGTVTGTLPTCDCATSTVLGTWGRLKTIYR